ncbi:MAG TPA: hypothetical protein HA258_07480 [Thermoplasmata archaeon]|jgi:hypothetical protein|nr:hypothetical protein [Thermoplasmata archaeon]HIH28599.1 hypothetical protein [Thermoplasmata archaeon]
MRKPLIYIIFCFFLILLPPLTVGMNSTEKPEGTPWFRDWTILVGLVTRHRHVHINGGEYVEFNAIFLHYRTHWFGNIRSGFFHHFDKIVLPAFYYGFLGNHIAAAKFNMGLAPY